MIDSMQDKDFLETAQYFRDLCEDDPDKLRALCYIMEELKAKADPEKGVPVKEIVRTYREISESKNFGYWLLDRDMMEFDYNSDRAHAREEGCREGFDIGRAKRLLQLVHERGYDEDTACHILNLTAEEKPRIVALAAQMRSQGSDTAP